jgi:hypothetical protein
MAKRWYNNCPRDLKIVAIVDKQSLFSGQFYCTNKMGSQNICLGTELWLTFCGLIKPYKLEQRSLCGSRQAQQELRHAFLLNTNTRSIDAPQTHLRAHAHAGLLAGASGLVKRKLETHTHIVNRRAPGASNLRNLI